MANVLIVFATRAGETEKIGQLIAEGIRMSGHSAETKKATEFKNASELDGYDAYVFGSATYHGGMLKGMKTFLFLAEKASLEGKVGASFGAFGWSGEAPGRIFDTMANIFKMKMVNEPLMLKSSALGGGIQMAQDYGREIVKKLDAQY